MAILVTPLQALGHIRGCPLHQENSWEDAVTSHVDPLPLEVRHLQQGHLGDFVRNTCPESNDDLLLVSRIDLPRHRPAIQDGRPGKGAEVPAEVKGHLAAVGQDHLSFLHLRVGHLPKVQLRLVQPEVQLGRLALQRHLVLRTPFSLTHGSAVKLLVLHAKIGKGDILRLARLQYAHNRQDVEDLIDIHRRACPRLGRGHLCHLGHSMRVADLHGLLRRVDRGRLSHLLLRKA
mmetsp:Transcript_11727/g.27640  ORF Transcript_11727/g.27640 Transcript_11727/m.27640 type:complete len:233 (+) Transcript_11727:1296-1994(+)